MGVVSSAEYEFLDFVGPCAPPRAAPSGFESQAAVFPEYGKARAIEQFENLHRLPRPARRQLVEQPAPVPDDEALDVGFACKLRHGDAHAPLVDLQRESPSRGTSQHDRNILLTEPDEALLLACRRGRLAARRRFQTLSCHA